MLDGQSCINVDCRVGYSHGGDVLSRKGIGGVADEQAGLTHGSARDAEDVLFSHPGIGFADRLFASTSLVGKIGCCVCCTTISKMKTTGVWSKRVNQTHTQPEQYLTAAIQVNRLVNRELASLIFTKLLKAQKQAAAIDAH